MSLSSSRPSLPPHEAAGPKLCTRCGRNPITGSIVVNGVYYADICNACKLLLNPPKISSGDARLHRVLDLEDHLADVQQPYNADGTINVQFARMYPRQAKAAGITDEQLRRASR